MKLLVINGVNLNMLGIREPDLYGKADYKSLVKFIKKCAKEEGVKVTVKQSDSETRIVKFVHRAFNRYDGIIINAGAYTHTSVAILDALKAVAVPTAEVHLTDINSREDFRKLSYISMYAEKVIAGRGFDGYKEAIKYFTAKKYC